MNPILENKQVGDSPHQSQGLLYVLLKHHEKNMKQSLEIVEPTKGIWNKCNIDWQFHHSKRTTSPSSKRTCGKNWKSTLRSSSLNIPSFVPKANISYVIRKIYTYSRIINTSKPSGTPTVSYRISIINMRTTLSGTSSKHPFFGSPKNIYIYCLLFQGLPTCVPPYDDIHGFHTRRFREAK